MADSVGSIVTEVLRTAAIAKKTDGSTLTVDAVVAASGAMHKVVLDQSQEKIASHFNDPAVPEAVTKVVNVILTAMPDLQEISTQWVKTLLRAGCGADLVGVGQAVRASLPKDVDKLIRAAEVVQKFTSAESFEKASFATPTEARLLLTDLCQLGALMESAELVDIFPNGPALLKGCSTAVGNHIGMLISQLSGCKKRLAPILSDYQDVMLCGQSDLDFDKHANLLDERKGGNAVTKNVQTCIAGREGVCVCVWVMCVCVVLPAYNFNTSTTLQP